LDPGQSNTQFPQGCKIFHLDVFRFGTDNRTSSTTPPTVETSRAEYLRSKVFGFVREIGIPELRHSYPDRSYSSHEAGLQSPLRACISSFSFLASLRASHSDTFNAIVRECCVGQGE
jgi:hypothetical protein